MHPTSALCLWDSFGGFVCMILCLLCVFFFSQTQKYFHIIEKQRVSDEDSPSANNVCCRYICNFFGCKYMQMSPGKHLRLRISPRKRARGDNITYYLPPTPRTPLAFVNRKIINPHKWLKCHRREGKTSNEL